MVTGADGVLAGTTTYDAMLPNIVNELPGYENDPVIVSAMREAMHHNLYALVNSSAMNGVGANTVVHKVTPPIVTTAVILAVVFWVLAAGFITLWVLGAVKFRKTEDYTSYKALKAEKK